MKRTLGTLFLGLFASAWMHGQTAAPHVDTLRIWDNATAPHSNGLVGPEQPYRTDAVTHTTTAELYVYRADTARATGQAVVICPGGGYGMLSMQYEGTEVARWLASCGVTAAVLKYRLPNGHPEVPLEDAVEALRIMGRLDVGAGGTKPRQVGIMGFSAGGHLAAMASTIGAVRPDFSILFYPVITAERGKGHQGSFNALLGASRNAQTDSLYSLQTRVTDRTPPALLLLSDDDTTVPPVNSLLYYEALKAHGISASMHIYSSGGHGWSFRSYFPYQDDCQQAVLDWLARLR